MIVYRPECDWCKCTFRLQLMCLWWGRQKYRKKRTHTFAAEVSVNLIRLKMVTISTPYLSTFHIVFSFLFALVFFSIFSLRFSLNLIECTRSFIHFLNYKCIHLCSGRCFRMSIIIILLDGDDGRKKWRIKNELKFRINFVIAHECARWQSTHCCGTVFFPYAFECGKKLTKRKEEAKEWI